MKGLASKFIVLVITVAFVGTAFNLVVDAIQPYMPLIGISIAVIVVLAAALVAWRIVSLKTKRFW